MIAVVILNWNGAAMLHRFLPSVLAYSAPEGEVIVVDNASTDESCALLAESFPSVRTIVLPSNLGFAEGYNEAFRRIEAEFPHRYEHYMLLNSDVEVTASWLVPLQAYLSDHPEVAAVQPKLRAEWSRDSFEYAGAAGGFIDRDGYPYCRGRLFSEVEIDRGQYDTPCSIFWASGAALLIRASDWHAAGGLDGSFFAHNEEIDLCWRLRSRGRGVACVPASVVYHVGGGTLPKSSPHKTYLNFRNNLIMLFKNLPPEELKAVLRRRMWLDYIAALKFLLTLDFANARAVWRARCAFRRLRPNYEAARAENLRLATQSHIAERSSKSVLFAYYAQGRRRYSDFCRSTEV